MTPFLYVGEFGPERTRNCDVSPREGFAFHFRFKPEDAKDDRFLASRWTTMISSLDALPDIHYHHRFSIAYYSELRQVSDQASTFT
jgi:hypothetical protein